MGLPASTLALLRLFSTQHPEGSCSEVTSDPVPPLVKTLQWLCSSEEKLRSFQGYLQLPTNSLSIPEQDTMTAPGSFCFYWSRILYKIHTHTRCLAWFGHPLPCSLLGSDLPGLIHSGTLSCSTLLPQVTSEGAERRNILFASLHRDRDLCPTCGSADGIDRETGLSPSLLQAP